MTFGSLFAGIGGFDLGLERAGMRCVWQVEIDDYATRVLEKHWPDVRRWGDVRTFPPDTISEKVRQQSQLQEQQGANGRASRLQAEPGHDGSEWQVDLICGGFPCQPVSCAGARRGDGDERWLWGEMRRVCKVLQPRWVLAENVPGLLSAGDVRGDLFGKVLRDLATLGYRVRWDCIPAAAVGAPHIRDRVFVLAYSRSTRSYGGGSKCERQDGPRARGESIGPNEHTDNVADAIGQHDDNGRRGTSQVCRKQPGSARIQLSEQWFIEPAVGRVADGVPSRVDRLRCLGNAVVPQVAEWIGRRIIEADA